jgi:CO/xanthine dehydrogenase FAD-binding subunit
MEMRAMMRIKEYLKPENLDKAYSALKASPNNEIIAGALFIRLTSKEINTAIDLSECGLRFINEHKDRVEVGAMTSYLDIIQSDCFDTPVLKTVKDALSEIMGIAFQNMACVGGTIYPAYPFSDLITVLMPLNCWVKLYKKDPVRLSEFIEKKQDGREILEKIIILKGSGKNAFRSFRKTSQDFSVLNLSVAVEHGDCKIAVGARPSVAQYAKSAMQFISGGKVNESIIEKTAEIACQEISFFSDIKASQQYRKHICNVLLKDALREVFV